jgi:hypothetical protein
MRIAAHTSIPLPNIESTWHNWESYQIKHPLLYEEQLNGLLHLSTETRLATLKNILPKIKTYLRHSKRSSYFKGWQNPYQKSENIEKI